MRTGVGAKERVADAEIRVRLVRGLHEDSSGRSRRGLVKIVLEATVADSDILLLLTQQRDSKGRGHSSRLVSVAHKAHTRQGEIKRVCRLRDINAHRETSQRTIACQRTVGHSQAPAAAQADHARQVAIVREHRLRHRRRAALEPDDGHRRCRAAQASVAQEVAVHRAEPVGVADNQSLHRRVDVAVLHHHPTELTE